MQFCRGPPLFQICNFQFSIPNLQFPPAEPSLHPQAQSVSLVWKPSSILRQTCLFLKFCESQQILHQPIPTFIFLRDAILSRFPICNFQFSIPNLQFPPTLASPVSACSRTAHEPRRASVCFSSFSCSANSARVARPALSCPPMNLHKADRTAQWAQYVSSIGYSAIGYSSIVYRLFVYRLSAIGYRLFGYRLFGYRLFGYRLFVYRLSAIGYSAIGYSASKPQRHRAHTSVRPAPPARQNRRAANPS